MDNLVEAKTRLLLKNIPHKEAEVVRLKEEVLALRQQAAGDDTEARAMLRES